jgi:hypothetical protein
MTLAGHFLDVAGCCPFSTQRDDTIRSIRQKKLRDPVPFCTNLWRFATKGRNGPACSRQGDKVPALIENRAAEFSGIAGGAERRNQPEYSGALPDCY